MTRRRPMLVLALLGALVGYCLIYGFFYALYTPWLLTPFLAPFGLLLVLAIWALPDTFAVPEKVLEQLFFAFMITQFLWPRYLAIDLPGLPWITFGRLFGIPLTVLLLATVSTSQDFRREMGQILSGAPLVWQAFVTLLVTQFLSIPLSHTPSSSLSAFTIQQTSQTAMFFLACYIFRRPGRAMIWVGVLWGLTLCVSLVGAIEFKKQLVLWSGHIPKLLAVQDENVLRILAGAVRASTGQYRTTSVFSTSLGLSEFLALSMPFLLHIAIWPDYRPIVRLAAAATVPFSILVILYTDSRLGLLGTFLSVMFYMLLWAVMTWRRTQSLVAPAVALSYPAMFAAGVAASLFIGRIRAKVWGTGQYEASNQGRMAQIQMGIPKVLSHPFGHGLNTSGDALGFANAAGVVTIDNYLLAVAMDCGIIGLAAFLTMFIYCSASGARIAITGPELDRETRLLMPLSVSMAVFLAIKTVFAQADNHPLLFMMMGMTVALIYRQRKREAASAMPQKSARPFRVRATASTPAAAE